MNIWVICLLRSTGCVPVENGWMKGVKMLEVEINCEQNAKRVSFVNRRLACLSPAGATI